MVVAFVIWSIVALIFVMIGVVNWRSKNRSWIFYWGGTGKKKDIVGYNHAVAKIWFFYAAIFEIIGFLSFLFNKIL